MQTFNVEVVQTDEDAGGGETTWNLRVNNVAVLPQSITLGWSPEPETVVCALLYAAVTQGARDWPNVKVLYPQEEPKRTGWHDGVYLGGS